MTDPMAGLEAIGVGIGSGIVTVLGWFGVQRTRAYRNGRSSGANGRDNGVGKVVDAINHMSVNLCETTRQEGEKTRSLLYQQAKEWQGVIGEVKSDLAIIKDRSK